MRASVRQTAAVARRFKVKGHREVAARAQEHPFFLADGDDVVRREIGEHQPPWFPHVDGEYLAGLRPPRARLGAFEAEPRERGAALRFLGTPGHEQSREAPVGARGPDLGVLGRQVQDLQWLEVLRMDPPGFAPRNPEQAPVRAQEEIRDLVRQAPLDLQGDHGRRSDIGRPVEREMIDPLRNRAVEVGLQDGERNDGPRATRVDLAQDAARAVEEEESAVLGAGDRLVAREEQGRAAGREHTLGHGRRGLARATGRRRVEPRIHVERQPGVPGGLGRVPRGGGDQRIELVAESGRRRVARPRPGPCRCQPCGTDRRRIDRGQTIFLEARRPARPFREAPQGQPPRRAFQRQGEGRCRPFVEVSCRCQVTRLDPLPQAETRAHPGTVDRDRTPRVPGVRTRRRDP